MVTNPTNASWCARAAASMPNATSASCRRRHVSELFAVVADDFRRFEALAGEQCVEQQPRARAPFAVDESKAQLRDVGKIANPAAIRRGHHDALVPRQQTHDVMLTRIQSRGELGEERSQQRWRFRQVESCDLVVAPREAIQTVQAAFEAQVDRKMATEPLLVSSARYRCSRSRTRNAVRAPAAHRGSPTAVRPGRRSACPRAARATPRCRQAARRTASTQCPTRASAPRPYDR